MSAKHQLEQLGHAFSILAYLLPSAGVQDRETSIDMPFIAVDAQHEINLDVFDPADVAWDVPGKLVIGLPCSTHAEEGGVRHGLRICCYTVMRICGDGDELGLKAGQDAFDQFDGFRGSAVSDNDERLTFWINARTVERVTRDDLNVRWKVLLECSNLRGFGRRLPAHDGAHFGRRPVGAHDRVDVSSFDTVHDPVATTGHEVTVLEDCDILLLTFQRELSKLYT